MVPMGPCQSVIGCFRAPSNGSDVHGLSAGENPVFSVFSGLFFLFFSGAREC
jgi:hypothetical protein